MPIEQIPGARFRDDETIVLYSEGGAHAAQAWVFLKAAGVRNVLFIAGGLGDWFDEVMNPSFRLIRRPARPRTWPRSRSSAPISAGARGPLRRMERPWPPRAAITTPPT